MAARFILIDNWLESVGGHNYQYAMEILRAAEGSGYQPVLATARSFAKKKRAVPIEWTCYPVFRYAWNRTHTVGVDGKRTEPIDTNGRVLLKKCSDQSRIKPRYKRWTKLLETWDRQRRIRAFKNACQTLHDQIRFKRDDIIFFPSVSEFDFLGLAAFLAANKETQRLDWHIQFHYDIFDGRPPDFNTQLARKECMEQQFSTALNALRTHQLYFYATTPQIADQYNRLQVGSFCPLPYPISCSIGNNLQPRLARKKPLRVTLAGAPRREKGKRDLNQLFDRLHKSNILGNDLQLWMQGNFKKLSRQLLNFDRSHLDHTEPSKESDAKIVVVPHPLERNKYIDLIQQTDIGLLPYNNARYHARASGVFIEMLSAGVPVIVTAGSWLAVQLAEPIYRHLENMLAEETRVAGEYTWKRTIKNDAPEHNLGLDAKETNLRISGDSQPSINLIEVPPETRTVIIQFPWQEQRPGYFVQLRTFQLDRSGREVNSPTQMVLSPRESGKTVSHVIPINPKTNTIRVEISNAYHDKEMVIGTPRISFLQCNAKEIPTGAVGLIASDMHQIPELLNEMVLHYSHYKESAVAHASTWNFKHSPLRTVEKLVDRQDHHKKMRGVA